MEEGAPLLGAGLVSGAGRLRGEDSGATSRSRQGLGRMVEAVEAVNATGPVVRAVRGKRREREKRGPPRIPGSGRTRGQPGQSRSAMCKRSLILSAPHGQVPTRLTEQKESWCRTTDKSHAGLRFYPLNRLSSLQEQAKPTRSRAPLQRQPRARAFDTGQGVERMVKRS